VSDKSTKAPLRWWSNSQDINPSQNPVEVIDDEVLNPERNKAYERSLDQLSLYVADLSM
jgi:hypothetical protein